MEIKKYSIFRIKKHPSKLNVPLAWALGSGLWALGLHDGSGGGGRRNGEAWGGGVVSWAGELSPPPCRGVRAARSLEVQAV